MFIDGHLNGIDITVRTLSLTYRSRSEIMSSEATVSGSVNITPNVAVSLFGMI